jgi:hypothetical protein
VDGETLFEGAKVLRGKRVMPEKKTLSTIVAIGDFDEVFGVFLKKKKKKAAVPKEGQSATPAKAAAGKSTAEKATEKKEPAEKTEKPVKKKEQDGKMDKELEERLEKASEKLLREQK